MTRLIKDAGAARDRGDMPKALALARQAYADAPGAPGPAFFLSAMLLECEDPEATTMIGTLDAFPDFAPGWEQLGRILLKRQPAAAHIAFGRAAHAYAAQQAAMPNSRTAYQLGLVLRQLGRLVPARAAMEWSSAQDATLPRVWFSLGLVCQDLHDQPAAIHAFQRALDLEPSFHEAAFNLGVAYQEHAELEPALDAYAKAWRIQPDSFGRIAQALVSPGVGRLWLHPSALRRELARRT